MRPPVRLGLIGSGYINLPADVTYIIGSKGMIDCDQYGAVRYSTGGAWTLYRDQPAFDFLKDYLDPNRLVAFSDQVQDFCRAILDDREPAVTGWDGRQAVGMAIAADLSAATGDAVRLPLSGSQQHVGERGSLVSLS
jgi:predicted dehydrogenase